MKLDAMDYSWARPNAKHLVSFGVTVAARYLWQGGKGVTAAEIAADHAAGLGVLFGYEAEPGNHLMGAAQGFVDGADARSLARKLGVPAGTPIYYACDRQVSAQMQTVALAYLRAADDPEYPARCYAQKSVCDAFGRPAWQTVAWSNGERSHLAVLYQYAINKTFEGSAVDYDTVINPADLGAWWPPGHIAVTATATEEDDMGFNLTDVINWGDSTHKTTVGDAFGNTSERTQQLVSLITTQNAQNEQIIALLTKLVAK